MIDIRQLGTFPNETMLPIVPESISNDPAIIGMSRALAPQIGDIATAAQLAILLPRIGDLTSDQCDAVAWGIRFNELSFWNALDVQSKRDALADYLKLCKCSGTRYAVKRIFKILRLENNATGIIEWWEEGAPVNTYRIVVDTTTANNGPYDWTSIANQAIRSWCYRFGRASQQLASVTLV